MKTVALYARVSSEQQTQQATIDSQIAETKERAQNDGYTVLPGDIYSDDGYSGATLVRPALERLRDRVAEGAIDIVYVHSPDRLARRYAYQVLLLDEFSRHGAATVFVHGPAGESAEDQLLVQVQGMIAEYERAKIMERCRRGKLHQARQGSVNPLSGAPYGYLYISKTENEPARYEPIPHEAKVVRQIFEWLVYEQAAIAEIVRRLNKQGIATRRGAARWDRSTVWAILRNPAYMGKAAFGKTEAVERQSLLRPIRGKNPIPRRTKSTYRDRPPEEWIYIDVPAIVCNEVFEAAKGQLEQNQRLSQRNGRGKRYLLQGLVVCAKCGYAYYGKTVSRSAAKGKKKWAYYRCIGTDAYRFAGGRICQNKQVRVDQLDGYVWESVCSVLQEPQRVIEEWSRRDKSEGMLTEMRQCRDEAFQTLTTEERRLQRLLDAYEAGAIDLSDLTERGQCVRTRIERARRNLKEAEADLSSVVEIRAVAEHLEAFHERICHRLDQLDWLERRQVIRMIVARVEIDSEGATVVYKVPQGGGGTSSGGAENEANSGGGEESFHLCGRRDQPLTGEHLLALCIRSMDPCVASEECDRRGDRRSLWR